MITNVAESGRKLQAFVFNFGRSQSEALGRVAANYSVQAIALLALLAYTVLAPRIETAPAKSSTWWLRI